MITGEVKIREQVVVTWTADCIEPTPDWPGHWNYWVTATGFANGRNFNVTLILPHERNSGVMALTASVMTDLTIMLREVDLPD